MAADEYLHNILRREAVDTGTSSPVRGVQTVIHPIIQGWATTQLVSLSPSGSFAKGTANSSGTDIDLFISLKDDTRQTLKELYYGLHKRITDKGYAPRHQNVSINVKVNGYSVDLVPAKRQTAYGEDHSIFRRKADTWTKTNVTTHIATVRQAGRFYESRILKLWRDQKGFDFPSFYLELTSIRALYGRTGTLSATYGPYSSTSATRSSTPASRIRPIQTTSSPTTSPGLRRRK